jgi:hypothetical protein
MSEQERLRKLREQQIQSRDPLTKQRKFQRNMSVKETRMRKSFSFAKAWGDIPHIIKNPLYALLFGGIITVILPSFWASPYATLTGGGITLILVIFGLVLGNAMDLRDDIRNSIK